MKREKMKLHLLASFFSLHFFLAEDEARSDRIVAIDSVTSIHPVPQIPGLATASASSWAAAGAGRLRRQMRASCHGDTSEWCGRWQRHDDVMSSSPTTGVVWYTGQSGGGGQIRLHAFVTVPLHEAAVSMNCTRDFRPIDQKIRTLRTFITVTA